jgi:lysophospholipase L1-like esterase
MSSTAPGAAAAGSARAAAPVRPLVYVAIGASDTVGVGADDPARNGWVPQLARLLGPGVHVHNLGSSGTLLRTARQDQLPAAIADQPDLVTVWLAVNDLNAGVLLDQYRADLDGLLASLGSQTHAVVLVANVPDLTRVPQYRGQDPTALRSVVQQWNQAIADTTARRGAHLVDLHAEYAELAAHPEDLSSDWFHPSSAGYARVAELFFEVARPLLGS